MKIDPSVFSAFLAESFPDAKCSLVFANPFECLVAVMLSAQTTDESVNRVTPGLFAAFPNPVAMAGAEVGEIEKHIRSLGLYHNKAKNLSALVKKLVTDYGGEVPDDFDALVSLPGVGIKTTNVVMAECFARPSIPVDTHVGRVAKRLGYAKAEDEPVVVEKKLEKRFPSAEWIALHHRIIAFGRAICHAQNPACGECGLAENCPYKAKASSKAGK